MAGEPSAEGGEKGARCERTIQKARKCNLHAARGLSRTPRLRSGNSSSKRMSNRKAVRGVGGAEDLKIPAVGQLSCTESQTPQK